MIVRMRLRKWDEAFEMASTRLNVTVKGAGVGFLEVYESLADLQAEYPDEHEFLEIKESKP